MWTGIPQKKTIANALIDLKLALQQRRFPIAETIAEHILLKVPTHPTAYYLLGMSAFMQNDLGKAIINLRQAFSYGLVDPVAHVNYANIVGQKGHHHLALNHLNNAVSLQPNFQKAWLMGYQLAATIGDTDATIFFAQGLVKNFPEVDIHWSYAANAYHTNIEDEKAIKTLKAGLELFPDSPELQVALAGILELQHKLEEADKLVSQILKVLPDRVDALVLQARIDRRNHRLNEAIATLNNVLKSTNTADKQLSNIHAEYVALYQLQSDYESAWQHAIKMNHAIGSERSLQGQWQAIEQQLAEIKNTGLLTYRDLNVEVKENFSVAFIVGFPRTGSTLIEKLLLNTFNSISVSESRAVPNIEKTIFDTFERPWWQLTPSEFSRLDKQSLVSVAENAYGLSRNTDKHTAVVDKNLFNILRLPLIETLFPYSTIIRVVRHPLDTLVSCYFANFQSTDAWHTDLQKTASYLAWIDNYWHHISIQLRLKVHVVNYEDLVKNEKLQSSLVDSLAKDWQYKESLTSKQPVKNNFVTRTASYEQVTHNIHAKSVGNYKKYIKHIDKTTIDTLREMMEYYGYVL